MMNRVSNEIRENITEVRLNSDELKEPAEDAKKMISGFKLV